MGLRGDFISDGKLQAFWTEMINKEQTNRAEWLVKHKSLMDKCVNRKPKEDRPDTAEMVARIRKLRGPTIPPPIKHTRKQFTTHFPDIKQLPPSELEKKFSEMDMKKAEPEVKKELYQGLSHFGEGRYRYLKKRQEIRPELKWNYTVTSGHEYGWKNGKGFEKMAMSDKRSDFK